RRADQRDGLTFVSPIDAEIFPVDGDNGMPWKQFAHANQAKVRQIRLTIGITFRQYFQLQQMIIAIEPQSNDALLEHLENNRTVPKVECGFSQNGFTRQERLVQLRRNASSPVVISVVLADKRNQES